MAIIRRKNLRALSGPSDIDLVDNPEKLLQFAEHNKVEMAPLNVEDLTLKLGITLKSKPLGDLSGILYKDESNNWFIDINQLHHKNRQRYTIAHELGHYFLHKHLKDRFEDEIFFRGGESSNEEWQANEFASCILMPEQQFRQSIKDGVNTIERLASKFEVSSIALRIRAKNLGMSGHGL